MMSSSTNWAAWTACLIRGDAERLRYWRERQRRYLNLVDVPEPWMFLWSTALVAAMEGDDPTDGLRGARERADSEGHDISADVVLACSLVAHRAGHGGEAAELLGAIRGRRLGNLSHYVLARRIRVELAQRLGEEQLSAAMTRGRGLDLDDLLDERGLGLAMGDSGHAV